MDSIFKYENYRIFLKTWIKNQPRKGRGILKSWSELLRVEPSILSQIFAGSRDLNPDQVFELQIYMGLGELEAEYFSVLVQIEKATTFKLKNHLKLKLNRIKKDSLDLSKRIVHEKVLTEEQKSIFYSSWIYSAIRNATSLNTGQTIENLCKLFNLPRNKVVEIVRFLVNAALIKEELGLYKIGPQRTHLDKNSPHIVKHHTNWRLKAIERAELLSNDELMFTGPLTISKKDFFKFREQIVILINNLSEIVKDSEAEELAVFQVDLFWMK